jgi:L-amino acid N-acyltransferase YncA
LVADVRRWCYALLRPSGRANAKRLRQRGESVDSIVFRDAVAEDIEPLAELHVTLGNATYRTTGPSVAVRSAQWRQRLAEAKPTDFVLIVEDRTGRLIGFASGEANVGEFVGVLNKIYLRWDYHGLGLGRKMMEEVARRFLDRGIRSFMLFADRSNPTIGFYDRMGGERLLDERGHFTGAYGWRDVPKLLG